MSVGTSSNVVVVNSGEDARVSKLGQEEAYKEQEQVGQVAVMRCDLPT